MPTIYSYWSFTNLTHCRPSPSFNNFTDSWLFTLSSGHIQLFLTSFPLHFSSFSDSIHAADKLKLAFFSFRAHAKIYCHIVLYCAKLNFFLFHSFSLVNRIQSIFTYLFSTKKYATVLYYTATPTCLLSSAKQSRCSQLQKVLYIILPTSVWHNLHAFSTVFG